MKKILLALGILTFPLTANAQTPSTQVSDVTMQATIKEFSPPLVIKDI